MKIDNLDIQDKIIQPGGVAVFCLKTSLASSSLIHQHGPPLPPASLFKLLRPNNSFRGKSICMSIQYAFIQYPIIQSNKSEKVKVVKLLVRSFYKSPESVMLRKIYLVVITDQLITTTSRSDQSHETKISRCLQSCRVLTRCWRPTSLSHTLLRLSSHTSHQNVFKAQNSSKSHAN